MSTTHPDAADERRQAAWEERLAGDATAVTVCTTHGRFVPCRRCATPDPSRWSADPDDVAAVRQHQQQALLRADSSPVSDNCTTERRPITERWAARRLPKDTNADLPWVLMEYKAGGYWEDYASCRHEWQVWILCDILDDADRHDAAVAPPAPNPELLTQLRRWLTDDAYCETTNPDALITAAIHELERLGGITDPEDSRGR